MESRIVKYNGVSYETWEVHRIPYEKYVNDYFKTFGSERTWDFSGNFIQIEWDSHIIILVDDRVKDYIIKERLAEIIFDKEGDVKKVKLINGWERHIL